MSIDGAHVARTRVDRRPMANRSSGCVVVVDSDAAARAAIATAFVLDGFHCTEAASGAAAIEAIRAAPPTVVVLEVTLPDTSGYELCQGIRRQLGDRVAIILVSESRTSADDRVAGLLIGADEYLVKPVSTAELLVRVRALTKRLRPPGTLRGTRLTPRETAVYRLLAEGIEQNGIAAILAISPRTVATHIERILRKVGAHSRAHAVAIAYQCGFMASGVAEDSPVARQM